MKEIVVLDVDGVLNPHPFDIEASNDWKFEAGFRSSKASGRFTLNLSKEMGKAIDELRCDIIWLTTWGSHAHINIAHHFDWPSFPILAEPPEDSSAGMYGGSGYDSFWKVRAMQFLLAEPGAPVFWIDDDISFFEKQCPWFNTIDPHKRLHTTCPLEEVGITKMQIEKIKELINESKRID